MNLDIDHLKSAAASGDANAMSKLASMHISGMFPGANPQEGIKLLEKLINQPNERYAEMIELGLHYLKGDHVPVNKDKGLALIEKGIAGLGDAVPFEHCFEIGMILTTLTDVQGEKILKWQKLSARLFEKLLADTEGMAMLEAHMGQQAVMMIKGLLGSVKGWLSAIEKMEGATSSFEETMRGA